MKKTKISGFVSLILVVALMFAVVFGVKNIATPAPAAPAGGTAIEGAVDGTYTSTTKGFGGDITAEVTIAGGMIADVQVTGPNETEGLGSVAVEKLPGAILAAQSLNIDTVSGASVSSGAIIAAVDDCLAQAGIDSSKLTGTAAENVEKTDETMDVDVVVIGAGGAGMTAAIEAKQAGMNVVILEKMPYVGGNTTKASGGMNAAGTKMQQAAAEAEEDPDVKAAILDSTVENYIADTMAGGHDINNIDLVTTMAEKSSDAVDWLESIGAPLPTIAATGGTVHYYLHEPEDGSAVGEFLVQFYTQKLDEMGIEVMLETEATEILTEDGKAVGVKAVSPTANLTVNAKAVVLATGGFGANFDMMASYDPALANAVTTNTPAATGDGIVMAEAIGADTVDMEYIQLHPTVYQENGLLVSERLRSNGAILINKEGKRFTNDLATRDAVSQAELAQPDAFAYIVYDSKYAEEKLYQKYETNGLTVSSDTLEGLATEMGLEGDAVANFTAAVDAWNKVCNGEAEDEFGRNNGLVSLDQAPFTAIKIAPGIHHTMGGLKIDTTAEVINTDGAAIPGLFAAGEVTGGVHGGNRIGGNAVADIVVYGRIAAQSAVDYVNAQ
ncbi:MAG: flavocytochrome c [Lachnospiraceae bacterium]|nr:flavocytochrome c [Lachnospiraceae bacterium]